MIKHPTLSAEKIEELQRWCFNEDFQRLGPSIFRTLEARLLGYRKLKDSPNPRLAPEGASITPKNCGWHIRRFWRADCSAPTRPFGVGLAIWKAHPRGAGPAHAAGAARVRAAVGAALWTGLTLKLDLFQHPKLMRTAYRMPAKRWAGSISGRNSGAKPRSPIFQSRLICSTPSSRCGCGWRASCHARRPRVWAAHP